MNKNGTLKQHTATESALKGNIVKYATRKKDNETDEERYDKIIHYAKLGKELL